MPLYILKKGCKIHMSFFNSINGFHFLIYIYIFIVGAIIGSFSMAQGYRIVYKLSLKGRSCCESCSHPLKAIDLIPIFSFFFCRGRCRYCHEKISPKLWIIELLSGGALLLGALFLPFSKEWLVAISLLSFLVMISVTDLYRQLIPNKIIKWFFLLFGLERLFVQPFDHFWLSILGFLVGFGTLFLLRILSRGGMGGGDIKLFGVLGIVVGPIWILVILFVASVLAVILTVILTLVGRGKRKVSFGPYVAIATWLCYVWLMKA